MRLSFFACVLTIVLLITSCSSKLSESVVAEYGNEKITLKEFEKAYIKTVGDSAKAKQDSFERYKDFLDLYVKYKMKLADAKTKGYDKKEELQNEFIDYKKNIGSTLIIEKQIKEPGIKDLYEKRKIEFRASHIMIRTDTLSDEKAKLKAEQVLLELKNGGDWNELAKKYSDDNYSKNNGGDVYYLRAGMVDESFENAVFATNPGSIYPEPVKTDYGYHIIKVTDKLTGRFKISLQHILIDYRSEAGGEFKTEARKKAEEILARIKSGEDFGALAKEFSADPGSRERGGDLGYCERRRFIIEFEEPAFKLKVGEVSDIVETKFGFHIIKCTGEQEYPPFSEQETALRKMYEKSLYQKDLENHIQKFKSKINYQQNEELISFIDSNNDSVKFNKFFESDLSQKVKGKPIITFSGKEIPIDTIINYAITERIFSNQIVKRKEIESTINLFNRTRLIEEEALALDENNAEFADLMADYKNGIYIFKLLSDEIWSKVDIDSLKMKELYDANKEKYRFPERINYSMIMVKKDSVANALYSDLKSGADFNSIVKSGLSHSGLVPVDMNEYSKRANKLSVGEVSAPEKINANWIIIKLTEREMPRTKTFEEARAEVSGEVQESETKRLDEEYNGYLNSVYQPKYYFENLKNAYK